MSLSAADLQKKHALEGAPDPFPSLGGKDTTTLKVAITNGERSRKSSSHAPDTASETAFPSLGGPGAAKKQQAPSPWSAARVSRPVFQTPVLTDTFELDKIDLKAAGKDGK